MKSLALRLVAASALLFVTSCSTTHAPTAWEYRVIKVFHNPFNTKPELEEQLNQAGREGYVIVSSTMMPPEPSKHPETMVILKRPKR
jgi:hypothetical protein